MKKGFQAFVMLLAVCVLVLATSTTAFMTQACAEDKCSDGGHQWELESALGATCTSPAWYSYRCKRCGASKTEPHGEAMEHNWVDDGTTYPGCETPGEERMHCTACGKVWTAVIEPQGHCWNEGEMLQEPTCEGKGSRMRGCEGCGKLETLEVAATGHNWKTIRVIREATCTSEGKAEVECRVCGKEATRTLKKVEHTYTEWKITRKATEKSKGTRTAVCDVCGKKTSESYEYTPGNIAVYTTAGKVNLRAGAGKSNKQVAQVTKKGTCLGLLYEAAPDKDGVIWYKVKYNNKFCWVMSDYAEAIVDASAAVEVRLPESGTELTGCIFKSVQPVADKLGLEAEGDAEAYTWVWSNETVSVSGETYVEQIVLSGKGYRLYGVKVGDKIKTAQSTLKNKDLILLDDGDGQYTYRVPALPDALSVAADGGCGYLTIVVDENDRVEMIRLYSDTIE